VLIFVKRRTRDLGGYPTRHRRGLIIGELKGPREKGVAMAKRPAAPLLRYIHKLVDGGPDAQVTDGELLQRFTGKQNEAAFQALFRRHAPMVLAVGRRVLGSAHDAEDVCQATFLLLAQKAASARLASSLAGWLYKTSHHLALKVLRASSRRSRRESRAAPRRAASPLSEITGQELLAVLDEELLRLPESLRAPLVLCYLEGATRDEAAHHLGCGLATLKKRLERGRERLHGALIGRGLSLSAVLLGSMVAQNAAGAAAITLLAGRTAQAASALAAGRSAAGIVSDQITQLLEGGLGTMCWNNFKVTMAVLLLGGILSTAGVMAYSERPGAQVVVLPTQAPQTPQGPRIVSEPPPPGRPRVTTAEDPAKSLTYRGRVLGPDGQPVAGAKLYVTLSWIYVSRTAPSLLYATSGPDGRFQFAVPKARFEDRVITVAAIAAKYGAALLEVQPQSKRDDLVLQLVTDAPITGQIVNLEGKPIAGATVRVVKIKAAAKEDLEPWLAAVKAKGKKPESRVLEYQHLTRQLVNAEVPAVSKEVTDGEGRFKLTGIGRNRLVVVRVDGPTIASQQLRILTRGEELMTVEEPQQPFGGIPTMRTTYYGTAFKHAVGPTRPIVGLVEDKDTKQGLPGWTIIASFYKEATPGILYGGLQDFVEATTDKEGRYRLTGVPPAPHKTHLRLVPPADQPYFSVRGEAPDSSGLEPVTADFEVKRGIWIEGRIRDKVTGQPLQGRVDYAALVDNPRYRESLEISRSLPGASNARTDGGFRIVGLPGPGILRVQHNDRYLGADERDDADGTKDLDPQSKLLLNAVARIDPPRDVLRFTRDIMLDPGLTFRGKLLGPDGEPVTGARTHGLTRWWHFELPPLATAEFTVRACNPNRSRTVVFHHAEKRLAGVLVPAKDDIGKPITVKMQRGNTIKGRLVDADGQPRANVALQLAIKLGADNYGWEPYPPNSVQTDKDGRFHIDTLLPGHPFRLHDPADGLSIRFGSGFRATTDLGDVQTTSDQ
jgi:RNA polymerase sigma factor (sigma-70 family)